MIYSDDEWRVLLRARRITINGDIGLEVVEPGREDYPLRITGGTELAFVFNSRPRMVMLGTEPPPLRAPEPLLAFVWRLLQDYIDKDGGRVAGGSDARCPLCGCDQPGYPHV